LRRLRFTGACPVKREIFWERCWYQLRYVSVEMPPPPKMCNFKTRQRGTPRVHAFHANPTVARTRQFGSCEFGVETASPRGPTLRNPLPTKERFPRPSPETSHFR